MKKQYNVPKIMFVESIDIILDSVNSDNENIGDINNWITES